VKASVLRKRREKLLRRQHWLLHELAGIYGLEYHEVLADCAARMRQHGLVPDPRLDESLVRTVAES